MTTLVEITSFLKDFFRCDNTGAASFMGGGNRLPLGNPSVRLPPIFKKESDLKYSYLTVTTPSEHLAAAAVS